MQAGRTCCRAAYHILKLLPNLCRAADMQAEQLVEEAQQAGLALDAYTCSALVQGRLIVRDFRGAWHALADMRAAGVCPSKVSDSQHEPVMQTSCLNRECQHVIQRLLEQ